MLITNMYSVLNKIILREKNYLFEKLTYKASLYRTVYAYYRLRSADYYNKIILLLNQSFVFNCTLFSVVNIKAVFTVRE